jgi:DedD protein
LQDLSDRALKERVIGAVVLVLLAVLVVPIFLDGPSDDTELVSESVTLPGQNDQERRQQTIVLNRDRSEPVPTSRPAATATPTPEPERKSPPSQQPAREIPAPKPAEPTPEPASGSSETGMWAVQLGSFSSKENAEKLAGSLRDQGYAAFLSQLQSNGNELHRVRIGPQKDRQSAEAVAAQLAKNGHTGQVVSHP